MLYIYIYTRVGTVEQCDGVGVVMGYILYLLGMSHI